ncbi:MAG: FHA domain-containing protein [Desulfobulbaceae bacterium]|nr:FHA domain-containing protein [Desulfobulbaceae bacterium]
MLQILLKFNDNVFKVFQSDKAEITIGRNMENDIQIDNLAVSNFHARIKRSQDYYFIEDLNSTNGTYINEEKIAKCEVQDGDTASIGKHSLTFLLEGGANEGRGLSIFEMEQTRILDTEKQRELVNKAEPRFLESPARLKVQEGETSQDEYLLTERLTEIGKGVSSQVKLEGLFTPKNLAYITRDHKGYTLIPGDNAGKLRLNGMSIDKGTALKNNDAIVAGKIKFRFLQG